MNKIEFAIKCLPTKRTPDPESLQINSTKHLGKKEKILFLHKIFQTIKKEGVLPTLFYISLILRAHQTNTLQEMKGANQYLNELRHKNLNQNISKSNPWYIRRQYPFIIKTLGKKMNSFCGKVYA